MKHVIKCKDWPIQPAAHVDFNDYIRIGTILGLSSIGWTTCYGHMNKAIPSEFIDYYPECFIEFDKEDLDKLKSHPDAKLTRGCYTGHVDNGVWVGRQFICD